MKKNNAKEQTEMKNGTSPSRYSILAVLVLALVAASGPAASIQPASKTSATSQKDIVSTAVAAGSFKTLAAALQAAGLVDTLKGAGPFTVFAPTDAAFAKLPAGTVETLLKPENKAKLTAILTYHVVPGRLLAGQVAGMGSATTVNGKALAIRSEGGTVSVGGADVVGADILCSNGVIHVIDTVLLPN
jgi:uncharacterized surface protein with fasciclin (FAS1) repeats